MKTDHHPVRCKLFFLAITLPYLATWRCAAAALPPLPQKSGAIEIEAQEAVAGEERTIKIYLHYPDGELKGIKPSTGLMLSLHNWGGRGFSGAPAPAVLVKRYDVVVIGVDYFQSGDQSSDPNPYDFGVLQACDALRALYATFHSLQQQEIAFDRMRLYATGGSGGGNVSLMAAKFAPHTFACVVDLSGMASLTDDIAYNLPGGSGLNARYSRDPTSSAYLSPAMQELRDLGNRSHLSLLAGCKSTTKIISVHGRNDTSCLWEDKERVIGAMRRAGLNATLHTISKDDVDGKLIANSGHALGNRTELLEHFAGRYLTPGEPQLSRTTGPNDMERKTVLTLPLSSGSALISFREGWRITVNSP